MTGKPTENPESSLNHAGTVVAADPAQAATVGRQISASDFSFSGLYQDRPLSSLLPAVAPYDLVAGRYLIGAKLGEGGMGSVYLAEQLQPVRRQVAFKVMQPGQLTSQLVARFEAERQTLALMDHPNIARIFDGGILGEAPGRGRGK